MLAGVILAGGKSGRMGTDKSALVIPKTQQSLLVHCQQTLSKICDAGVFTSGEQHPDGIVDRIPGCGPLSGVHAVVKHIQAKSNSITGLLVTAVDMPEITIQDLAYLAEIGEEMQSLSCFENCFLPFYMPFTANVIDYLDALLLEQKHKTVKPTKPSQYAVKTMFKRLQGEFFAPLKHTQLNNINTLEQWQTYCAKQSLIKA